MKKYTIIATVLAVLTAAVCLACYLTHFWLEDPVDPEKARLHMDLLRFTGSILIPAVCLAFAALLLLGKLSLEKCAVFTLIVLFVHGVCQAAMAGAALDPQAWFVNMQGQILKICPLWFTAILVYGAMEKKTLVWILSAAGLVLLIYLQTVVVLAFPNTTAAAVSFTAVTSVSLVLVVSLGICGRLTAERKEGSSPG